MQIQSDDSSLALELLEKVASQSSAQPDLNISAAFTAKKFAASLPSIWLDWADTNAFILELTSLTNNLKTGCASLSGMSPRDFILKIEPLNSRGHLSVTVDFGTMHYTENGQFECRLSGGFEITPDQLDTILNWFRDAVSTVSKPNI